MTTHYRWETALDQRRKKDSGIDAPERREAARASREAFVLGYHLARMRKERGLTQQMIAESMGVSQVRVSRMENGELDRMQVDSISAYVAALGGQLELVADFDAPSEDEHLGLAAVSRAVIHAVERLWAASGRLPSLHEPESLDQLRSRLIRLQFESIALSLERRIRPLLRAPGAGAEDIEAAAREALAAFEVADVTSDSMLYAIDYPDKIATLVHDTLALSDGRLDLAASRFYELLATACSTLFADVVHGLTRFGSMTAVAGFGRLSLLAYEVESRLSWPTATFVNEAENQEDHEDYTYRYLCLATGAGKSPQWDVVYVEPKATVTRGRSTRLTSLLESNSRVILSAGTGSGKTHVFTTLLWQLQRAQASAEPRAVNKVPFLIRLREYADSGLPTPEKLLSDSASKVATPLPPGWAQRQLKAGHAIVVMDGLDEMAKHHQPDTQKWLRRLLSRYPDNHVVITSRPHAVDADWLREDGFVHASIEPLTPSDQRKLIRSWHTATAKSQPADMLAARQSALLALLEVVPGLRELAGIPLLTITMSKANLSQDAWPGSRAALYGAALESLLQTRSAVHPLIGGEHSTRIPQYLAWRLLLTGRTDMERSVAEKLIAERLASTLPRPAGIDAVAVLDWLTYEGGLLRESSLGTITFTYRALQDYLAAREAADSGEVGYLADNAHLDRWQEVVILAAGQLNRPSRDELLHRLLMRAAKEDQYSGLVKQTIVALMETLPVLSPDQKRVIDRYVNELIPPNDMRSALSLAAAGAEVLDKLPDDLSEMTTESAHSTVMTVRLLSGRRATYLLRQYAKDQRPIVRNAVAEAITSSSTRSSRALATTTARRSRAGS
ncbi:NACHT domain-containing protein [Nonomuraea angiospora]|uniref:NACHT domain-containing protein n=1 Tax=Nonomuraea angiospora TaxID=46172 RepID=UPI003333924D